MPISKYNIQVKASLSSQNLYKTVQLDLDEEIVMRCHGNKEKLTRALEVFIRPYFARYDTLREIRVVSCVKA